MPTIKDIAKLAGVSHGTVSNVMNKKGNVSIEKINLVENAARVLGYQPNALAKQLRKGRNKFVGVILPDFDHKTYVDLLSGLEHHLREDEYFVNGYRTGNIPHSEEVILEQVLSLNPDYVIVVSSFLKNDGLYDDSSNIIFVDRFIENMPTQARFFSFDFHKAGIEIGEQLVADGHKRVALYCDLNKFSDEKEFQRGLSTVLEAHGFTLRIFSGEYSLSFSTAFDILQTEQKFDAIVTTNRERIAYLQSALSFMPGKILPKLYSISSTEILPAYDFIKYELDYKLLGKRIGQYVLSFEKGNEIPANHFLLPNDGFKFQLPRVQAAVKAHRLNFLTLSSPTAAALKKILPLCAEQTGITVEVTELDYNELHRTASLMTRGSFYDLIRLDMLWLSELGPQLFRPLDLGAIEISPWISMFSSSLSHEYFEVNGTVYALPFDPSVEMLYYRKDLFEDAKIKREFYEQHKAQLRAPQNYEEYNLIARFFTKKFNPGSPTNFGASLVFGTAAVAACDYLPRFKALGGKIFDESGLVRINTPLARRALDNYIESYHYSENVTNMWWGKALENFAGGRTAMVSSFSNHASVMLLSKGSNVVGKIGFAPLPGGHPLLGGGIIGISKDSQKYQEALAFLQWIYQANNAAIITYLGGYSPCQNIYENEELLTLFPWIEGIEQGFLIGSRRNMTNHKPGFSDVKFEEILGTAVRNAVIGVIDSETALRHAQELIDIEFNQQLVNAVDDGALT